MKKRFLYIVALITCATCVMAQSSTWKLNVHGKVHATDSIIAPNLYITGGGRVGGQLRASSIRTSMIYPTGSYLTLSTTEVHVPGTIKAKEIIVNTSGADFVFDKSYDLRPLDEVNAYIQEHQHLPEIPSAVQMQEEGMSVDQMVTKLLQKVEELTLYTILQEERIKELENNQK